MLRVFHKCNRIALLVCALVLCFACLFAFPSMAHAHINDSATSIEGVVLEDSGVASDTSKEHVAAVLDGKTQSGNAEQNGSQNVEVGKSADGNDNGTSDGPEEVKKNLTENNGQEAPSTSVDLNDDKKSEQPANETTQEPQKQEDGLAEVKQSDAKQVEETDEAPDQGSELLAAAGTPLPALGAQASTKFVIVIDPGHGGYDSGANGYVVEKDVNLSIATYLRKELENYTNVSVYMTRTDDTYVSLGDRVKMAVNWGANVVVSIHNNAGGGRGAEVIVPNSSSWYYDACYAKGQQLGGNILSELMGVGLSKHAGVYSKNTTNNSRYADGSLADYFTLVEGPREHGILGIIIEHAFVDTASDAKFLQGDSNLKTLALADARGIAKTYSLKKVDPTTLTYEAPLAAGTYVIATAKDSGQVLDVAGGSKANGANVLLWGYHNVAWEKWTVSYDSKGHYTIKNMSSGKVLDASGNDAYRGVNVLMWEAKSKDYFNQRWVLAKSGDGYIIKSLINPDYVLDCWGDSAANGTNIALWDANGGTNQLFFFINTVTNVSFGQTIANGTYTVGVSNKKTQLVEVQGCSKANCGNVDLYESNGGANQRWQFQYNGSGYYTIKNINSGLLLDVEGARLGPGGNVLQFQSNGGKNQLWGIADNKDGTYSICSALNGMALDVTGASTANLANIEIWTPNNGANQKFYLTAASSAAAAQSSGYAIMGTTSVTAAQMVNYYKSTGASYPSSAYSSKGAATINDFVNIAIAEANAEGVKAEVLFAQAMLETGNLKFGGLVQPSQCNFGGIGATGTGVHGATFYDVRQGLRAQVQHLKAYASTTALKNACVDPRFNLVSRGSATTVEQLSGKWATGSDYGAKILTIINNIKKK